VSLHRFLVPPEQWHHAATVEFSQPQAHQLERVLRLQPGDRVRVFDGERPCDAVVELVSAREGRIVDEVAQAAEPRTRVCAYPCLLPREKFESVLQKLTEVGVAAIVPVLSQRALVREAPDEARLARWRAILREATEQSGRGRVPELRPAQAFAKALRQAPGTRLVAYAEQRDGLSLPDALDGAVEAVSLFVGPEGDYSPDEVAQARQAGARIVSLGSRILRAETASPVFAALVLYELERESCGS
jgi:16S rRNA (uracil1498-N3)-methyltransferase